MTKNIKDILDKIKVISDAEAEQVDFVVCVPASTPSHFDDDLFGFCSHCGVKVRYRWHAPRKPKKICLECAVKTMPEK
jgi:hypothetical protein